MVRSSTTTPKRLFPRSVRTVQMCHSEHVFHRPCRHWGRERLQPCCRSRVVNGFHTGCGYIESLGPVTSQEQCFACNHREAIGHGRKPFPQITGGTRLEPRERTKGKLEQPVSNGMSSSGQKIYRTDVKCQGDIGPGLGKGGGLRTSDFIVVVEIAWPCHRSVHAVNTEM